MFGNHTNLFCHAVIVGNSNAKKVERQSARAYFTWDITWTWCNACNPTFFWSVRCTLCSCRVCPQAWGTFDRKSAHFELIANFFLNGVVFMFWNDNFHIELLYWVKHFELVWTWNKVAVVENAKSVDCTPPSPTFLTAFDIGKGSSHYCINWYRSCLWMSLSSEISICNTIHKYL